jgi:uncharacterized membrane protein HdeD (DUF308 family)
MTGLMRNLSTSTLITGLLTIALGVLILVWPGKSILVASVLFGVYLLVTGFAEIYLAFALPAVSGANRILLFISGALSLVLAILAFRHFGEGYAVLLLSIWIGVGFIFQGVAEITTAVGYPELPGRGWYVFAGVITVIAGIVVLAWPFDSIVVLALVTGVWLVVIGLMQVVRSFQIRRDAHKLTQAGQAAGRYAGASS